jgi:hypothetical protein
MMNKNGLKRNYYSVHYVVEKSARLNNPRKKFIIDECLIFIILHSPNGEFFFSEISLIFRAA